MAKRVALVILGAMVIALLSATVALASWTPGNIYDDYAAHGKLTRDYTEAELLAYLNDSSLAQYGDTDLKKTLDAVVKDRLDRGEFPYTGTQIAIFAVVVVVLLGGGIALWYYSRPRRREDKEPTGKGPEDKS